MANIKKVIIAAEVPYDWLQPKKVVSFGDKGKSISLGYQEATDVAILAYWTLAPATGLKLRYSPSLRREGWYTVTISGQEAVPYDVLCTFVEMIKKAGGVIDRARAWDVENPGAPGVDLAPIEVR